MSDIRKYINLVESAAHVAEGDVVPFKPKPWVPVKGDRVGYAEDYLNGSKIRRQMLGHREGTVYKTKEADHGIVAFIKWDDGGNSGNYIRFLRPIK